MSKSMTLYEATGEKGTLEDYYLLQNLIERYGQDCTGSWLVVRTAYHSGGIVSHHREILQAIAALRRYPTGDCICGCVGIVPAAKYLDLPVAEEAASIYVLAR